MNLVATAAELLSERLGLSTELLGDTVIARALELAFEGTPFEDREIVASRRLQHEGEEWQILVDEVVVPETWFFRHSEAFQFLASYLVEKWKPANLKKPFQALCIPCASGEEAYSVGMTLLDAGLDAGRVRIDAADVSQRLLDRAKRAVYGKTSFREKGGRPPEKYLLGCDEGWRVREEVARLVRFEKANLLDLSRFRGRSPYDAIFCRNVLIYLDEGARRKVVENLRELLDEETLLFCGPSELTHFRDAGYVAVDYPQSFVCRKPKPTAVRPSTSSPGAPVSAPVARRAATTKDVALTAANESVAAEPAAGLRPNLEQAQRLADSGDLDAATIVCEGLLKGGAHDPTIYALLGVIQESKGALQTAEEFFRKALYLDPNSYESLLHMSVICERRGKVEAARLYRSRAGRAVSQQKGTEVLKSV